MLAVEEEVWRRCECGGVLVNEEQPAIAGEILQFDLYFWASRSRVSIRPPKPRGRLKRLLALI